MLGLETRRTTRRGEVPEPKVLTVTSAGHGGTEHPAIHPVAAVSPAPPQDDVRISPVTKTGKTHRTSRPGRIARLVASVARRHWALVVLLIAGLALRVMAQLAYRPALLYIDSRKYLLSGLEGFDPEGYRSLLRPALWFGNLGVVVAVQHVLGMAMATALYILLIRRGAPRWAAGLAAAPVLLDAYQLQIEQTIMPEVMFETLIVAVIVILLWNRRLSLTLLIVAGFVLGASATVRVMQKPSRRVVR
jgi:hypothetical protein